MNDVSDAQTMLAAMFQPDDLVELRLIRWPDVRRRWITAGDYESISAELDAMNKQGFEVYFGVNCRSCKGSTESAVSKVVAFHVDLDAPERCRSACQAQGHDVPLPSLRVASGHGEHWYWILESPVTVTVENKPLLKGVNRGLALALDGDPACCDLSRILRLPGFINHKPPTAQTAIIELTGLRYPADSFSRFAVAHPESDPVQAATPKPLTPDLLTRFESTRKADTTGQLTRAWRGELGDGSSSSRYVLAKMLAARGYSIQEIVDIACSRRWWNKRACKPCVKTLDEIARDIAAIVAKQTVPSPVPDSGRGAAPCESDKYRLQDMQLRSPIAGT